MIRYKNKPPQFKKTFKRFDEIAKFDPRPILHKYGKLGVGALRAATPQDTGEAGMSWSYKITGNRYRYALSWTNSDMAGRVPLVILLQYGHATKSGYFLSGRDFINPALRPIYDGILREAVQEARA